MNKARPYGELVNRYEDSTLILSESLYLPETIIRQHSHRHAYFCILLRGAYTEKFGSRSRECKQSTVVFHPPDESHSTHFLHEGGHLFRFELKPELFKRICNCSSLLAEPAKFEGGIPAQLAAKLYREFRQTDEVSVLVIEGLALEIAAYVARERRNEGFKVRPIWLLQASELIHEQFARTLSLEDIAKIAGVHPLHLARVFRRFEGCTIGEYIRKLRVDFAAHQLSNSKMSLADVALASGFCDQAHFSKTFRLLTGMTPLQYRSIFSPSQPHTKASI
jgi:AraC family transcriptional regulator